MDESIVSDSAFFTMHERAVFPVTITVGESKIELLGDGTWSGDGEKMRESISAMKSFGGGDFALQAVGTAGHDLGDVDEISVPVRALNLLEVFF